MKRYINNMVFQICLPFLAFLLIPLFFLNAAIFGLLNNIRQEEYTENLTRLETSCNYLQSTLAESIRLARKLTLDTDLQQLAFLNEKKEVSDYARLYTADRNFQQYFFSDTDSYSLHVYYVKNSILLSSSGTCDNLSYFYGKNYQFGEYSFDDFNQLAQSADYTINFHPYNHFLLNHASFDGFFYTTSLNNPTNSNQSKGLILLILHQSFLDKSLEALNTNGAFSYITDQNGQLLTVLGSPSCEIKEYLPTDTIGYIPQDLYGKTYAASYLCLPEGINIYNVRPADTIVARTGKMTYLVLALNFAALLLCILLIVSITRKRHLKLKQTFSMLNFSKPGGSNYYDSINSGIATLLDSNQNLSEKLVYNVFILRNDFWNRLLHNSFSSSQEMADYAAHSDLNLTSDFFCLLIFSVESNQSSWETYDNDTASVSVYREVLLNDLESKFAAKGYVHQLSASQLLLFLRISKQEQADYKDVVEHMLGTLPAAPPKLAVHCAGSRLFSSVIDASEEYDYCNNILLCYYNSFQPMQKLIVWSEKHAQISDLYFPSKLGDRMRTSIQSGKLDEVEACFRELFTNNFASEASITPYTSALLMARIKMLLLEVYRPEMDFDLYQELRLLDALSSDAVRISSYIKLAKKMCDYYRRNLDQKTDSLRLKIQKYISENFTSPSFSLTEVAACCGFSDSYFSMLFKEIMEMNFSSYVEQLKMDYADRLLRETDLKIDEISQKTGYSDVNAFRRAYKKYYAVSPSQRRTKDR